MQYMEDIAMMQAVLLRTKKPSAAQLQKVYHQTGVELNALIREIPNHLRPTMKYNKHFYDETMVLQHLAKLLANYASRLRE